MRVRRAPGFYADMRAGGGERYWDGERWTDEYRWGSLTSSAQGSAPVSSRQNERAGGIVTAGYICAVLVPIVRHHPRVHRPDTPVARNERAWPEDHDPVRRGPRLGASAGPARALRWRRIRRRHHLHGHDALSAGPPQPIRQRPAV
ncbi:MAG: DUF2510 domain-containing protein [Actinobacteria bacterium]|nr:MAG: DUF2510 domain-containing protein [Actinomycetota bacterium]